MTFEAPGRAPANTISPSITADDAAHDALNGCTVNAARATQLLRTRDRFARLHEDLQRERDVEERPQAELVRAEVRQGDDKPLP